MAVLYLIHHGEAVGPDVDPMRPLSDRGRANTEGLAERAAERGMRPDAIAHSGKLRAKQTAEIYRRRCNPNAPMSAVRGLQPTDPTAWIFDVIEGGPDSLMLVGHFPHLPRLLARLLTGNADAGPADFPLNGVVAIERENDRWVEKWRMV